MARLPRSYIFPLDIFACPCYPSLDSELGARCGTAQRSRIFILPADKEFLFEWANDLNEQTRKPISACHILSVAVSQLRNLRMQGTLFHELTEIEAGALRFAVEEYAEDARAIAIQARERRAATYQTSEQERQEAERRRRVRARLPMLVRARRMRRVA
jgi:hypothetical protein